MQNIQLKSLMIVIFLFCLSSNVYSSNIAYNFIQGAYGSLTDTSFGEDLDADVSGVWGSFEISSNLAFSVLYESTGYHENIRFIPETDITEFHLGLTAHTSVSSNTDIYGTLSIVQSEIKVVEPSYLAGEADDTGNAITLGIITMITDNIEFNAGLTRVDVFDVDTNATLLGARYFTSNKFSLGVDYRTADDVDTILFSARFEL